MNGMIQWLTQDLLVSLLGESVFFNESLEWMIQRQIATFLTAPFHHLKKRCAYRNWWVEFKFLFYNKYPITDLKYSILELELIFDLVLDVFLGEPSPVLLSFEGWFPLQGSDGPVGGWGWRFGGWICFCVFQQQRQDRASNRTTAQPAQLHHSKWHLRYVTKGFYACFYFITVLINV